MLFLLFPSLYLSNTDSFYVFFSRRDYEYKRKRNTWVLPRTPGALAVPDRVFTTMRSPRTPPFPFDPTISPFGSAGYKAVVVTGPDWLGANTYYSIYDYCRVLGGTFRSTAFNNTNKSIFMVQFAATYNAGLGITSVGAVRLLAGANGAKSMVLGPYGTSTSFAETTIAFNTVNLFGGEYNDADMEFASAGAVEADKAVYLFAAYCTLDGTLYAGDETVPITYEFEYDVEFFGRKQLSS